MKKAQIVIIGGGVVGASVAFHLTERGARDVVILEREPEQGRGSTGAATGGIRAQFETDINIRMSLYSLDFFQNCEFDPEYEPAGYLFFASNLEQFEYLKRNVEKQRSIGVKDVEIVDQKTVGEIVPGMNCSDVLGGSFGRNDGFINPLAVMRGFTEIAINRGARIVFDRPANAIKISSGRVVGVEAGGDLIECETAVICTGAWARDLAGTAGIELPVEPQRRQIVWGRTKERLPANLPMVIDIGSGFHFRPARDFHDRGSPTDGRDVLFAYPDPEEGASTNTEFDEAFVEKVYRHARHRAEFLFQSEVVWDKCRAGLYENSPDHHAILGSCSVDGLFFANGFSGHGVMHSPATGRAISELILNGEADFLDVSCLSLDRFVKGELLHVAAFI